MIFLKRSNILKSFATHLDSIDIFIIFKSSRSFMSARDLMRLVALSTDPLLTSEMISSPALKILRFSY